MSPSEAIRQAAREWLAEWTCDDCGYDNALSIDHVNGLTALLESVRREALEEAAQICWDAERRMGLVVPHRIAAAIRQLAEKEGE